MSADSLAWSSMAISGITAIGTLLYNSWRKQQLDKELEEFKNKLTRSNERLKSHLSLAMEDTKSLREMRRELLEIGFSNWALEEFRASRQVSFEAIEKYLESLLAFQKMQDLDKIYGARLSEPSRITYRSLCDQAQRAFEDKKPTKIDLSDPEPLLSQLSEIEANIRGYLQSAEGIVESEINRLEKEFRD